MLLKAFAVREDDFDLGGGELGRFLKEDEIRTDLSRLKFALAVDYCEGRIDPAIRSLTGCGLGGLGHGRSSNSTLRDVYNCRLTSFLGAGPGQDGFVLRSDRLSAVKFFDRLERFNRELAVYRVLQRNGTQIVAGHNIPRFLESDDTLLTIEMTVVDRPFVLDFAGAKLPDEIPDFGEEVMDEHHEHLRELFGDRCGDALHVAEMFRIATGYTLLDIHPGNIAFADVEPSS